MPEVVAEDAMQVESGVIKKVIEPQALQSNLERIDKKLARIVTQRATLDADEAELNARKVKIEAILAQVG